MVNHHLPFAVSHLLISFRLCAIDNAQSNSVAEFLSRHQQLEHPCHHHSFLSKHLHNNICKGRTVGTPPINGAEWFQNRLNF